MARKKKQKKHSLIFYLAVIFVVVAAFFLISEVGPLMTKDTSNTPFWENADKNAVTKVWMKNNSYEVLLEKNDEGNWAVNHQGKLIPAAGNRVAQLIDDMSRLTRQNVVSKNEKKHDLFMVSDEKGAHIKLKSGEDTLMHLLIGKRGPNFQSNYVREEGMKNVYMVNKTIVEPNLPEKMWYGMEIANVVPENVTAFTVTAGEESYTLQKEAGTWQIADDEHAVEEDAVAGYLALFGPLTGKALDPDAQPFDLETADYTVTLTTAEGDTTVYVMAGDEFTVTTKEKPFIFTLTKQQNEQLIPAREDFYEEDPVEEDLPEEAAASDEVVNVDAEVAVQ